MQVCTTARGRAAMGGPSLESRTAADWRCTLEDTFGPGSSGQAAELTAKSPQWQQNLRAGGRCRTFGAGECVPSVILAFNFAGKPQCNHEHSKAHENGTPASGA